MKPNTHPKSHIITVSCACGNSFETQTTSTELKVDVCSACHPFFTGTQRFVDTAGRVERFKAKLEVQKKIAEVAASKKKPAAKAGTEAKPE